MQSVLRIPDLDLNLFADRPYPFHQRIELNRNVVRVKHAIPL